MAWFNWPLSGHYACDNVSEQSMTIHGPLLSTCKTLIEFGRRFYAITMLNHSQNWVNTRARRGNLALQVFGTYGPDVSSDG